MFFEGCRDLWLYWHRGRNELRGSAQTVRPGLDRRDHRQPRRPRQTCGQGSKEERSNLIKTHTLTPETSLDLMDVFSLGCEYWLSWQRGPRLGEICATLGEN